MKLSLCIDDFGGESKCLVVDSDLRTQGGGGTGILNVLPYGSANLAAEGLVGNVKIFVYGGAANILKELIVQLFHLLKELQLLVTIILLLLSILHSLSFLTQTYHYS